MILTNYNIYVELIALVIILVLLYNIFTVSFIFPYSSNNNIIDTDLKENFTNSSPTTKSILKSSSNTPSNKKVRFVREVV